MLRDFLAVMRTYSHHPNTSIFGLVGAEPEALTVSKLLVDITGFKYVVQCFLYSVGQGAQLVYMSFDLRCMDPAWTQSVGLDK